MVSLTDPTAALENGGRHFPGRLSRRDDFESDAWSNDQVLAFHPPQCRLQRLCRGVADLGCDAVDHARTARLATSWHWQKFQKMNRNSSRREFMKVSAAALAGTLGGCVMTPKNKNQADVIIHNGRITTLDTKYPE